MSKKRRVLGLASLCGLATLAGALAAARPAHGQGNIQLGPVRVLPFLELSGEYDDNVLLAPRDEKSDFIWTISPGVNLELPGRRYAVRLGYRADILRYVDNDVLDTVHHTVQLDSRYDFPWKLTLRLSDEFKRTDDFAGFPVPELTSRTDRIENLAHAGAEYQTTDRIVIAVDYTFFLVNYDDAQFQNLDREDHQIALTLFYRVLPKTSILGEYDYQWIQYDQAAAARDRNSTSNKFKVGLKGDLTTKTSVTVKVGYEFKDYDNPATRDWTGLIVEGEVVWRYQEPSQLRLFVARQNVESTFVNNNFYVSTFGGAEVRHQLNPKLFLRVTGLVGVNDYDILSTIGTTTQKRSDDFYEARASLKYQIQRWLALELAYAYLVRNSNFGDFDYTDNRVRLSVLLTY